MVRTKSCDTFTWFALLSSGLLFVAALWTRGLGRSPTGIDERGVGRLPAWPDRIANRVPGRRTEPGPRCGRTRGRESDIPSLEAFVQQFEEAIEKLEAYAQQYEEAIERIRLRHQDFRRGM
jgi:hypothetical protein